MNPSVPEGVLRHPRLCALLLYALLAGPHEGPARASASSSAQDAGDYSSSAGAKETVEDYEGALQDYEHAIRLKPEEASFRLYHGNLLLKTGELQRGVQELRKAMELDPRLATPLRIAYCKRLMGDLDEALTDYDRMIAAKPDDHLAYLNRGAVKCSKKAYAEAIKDLERALELKPSDAAVHSNLGNAAYDMGDWLRAEPLFRKTSELDSSNAGYHRLRLWCARARRGDQTGASEELGLIPDPKLRSNASGWTCLISEFLQGKAPESSLLKAAERRSPLATRARKCEALFYAGTKALVQGDNTKAQKLFEDCTAQGIILFIEHRSAVMELERLRSRK